MPPGMLAMFGIIFASAWAGAGENGDPFLSHQWGLSNLGQEARRDIDDIHSERLDGVPGTDIGWIEFIKNFESRMKRNAVVAILDSGVDVNHPELKFALWKNLAECTEAGGVRHNPKDDRDGNGYPGDCLGWNFATDELLGSPLVHDELGHGTHLAGIIAANSGNRVGVSGVSNRIKILPVKVFFPDEGISTQIKRRPVTERIAKGIRYAVDRGADVINLSLGWPRALNTRTIDESIQYALGKNVTIVAAVGNNNHNTPTYPCAYSGVICVGSISVDGSISRFSNFGGKVDVLAPGDSILSSYPRSLIPDHFSSTGYEVKNGSSQAAPFVSAQAAILRSIFPEIKNEEIYARIVSSTHPIEEPKRLGKSTLHGRIRIPESIRAKPAPVVQPEFKTWDVIEFETPDSGNAEFKVNLQIKNYWLGADSVRIRVTHSTPAIRLFGEQNVFDLGKLPGGESKSVELHGFVLDRDQDSTAEFDVSVQVNAGEWKTFRNSVRLIRKLTPRDPLQSLSLVSKGKPFGWVRTIADPFHQNPFPDYYTIEFFNQDNGNLDRGIRVRIFQFRESPNRFEELNVAPTLPSTNQIIGVERVDLNLDGKADYLIRATGKNGDYPAIVYGAFHASGPLAGQPLWGQMHSMNRSVWYFTPDAGVADSSKRMTFLARSVPGFGRILVPCFLTHGSLPAADQRNDVWEGPDHSEDMRIYYLEPLEDPSVGRWVMRTRVLDTLSAREEVRRTLRLRPREQLQFQFLFPQTLADQKEGRIRVFTSMGEGTRWKFKIWEIDPDREVVHSRWISLDSQAPSLRAVQPIGMTRLDTPAGFQLETEAGLIGYYSDTLGFHARVQSSLDDVASLADWMVHEQADPREWLLSMQGSYRRGNQTTVIYQSKSKIVMSERDSNTDQTRADTYPISRFSFLPGSILRELFMPMVMTDSNGAVYAAQYVDATSIYTRYVYLLAIRDGKWVAPMETSILVPEGCRTLDPAVLRFSDGERRRFAYTFLCPGTERPGTWVIRYLEV